MGSTSSIEWTDATWTVTEGCSRVSPGCERCYAETIAGRFSDPGQNYHGLAKRTQAGPRWTNEVRLREDRLVWPLRWRKPRWIFVCSTSDLFHEKVPFGFIDRVFAVMALAPRHVFQVLTKRPERMREYVQQVHRRVRNIGGAAVMLMQEHESTTSASGVKTVFPIKAAGARDIALEHVGAGFKNLWLGTSVEDQKRADERIPHLLGCPAAVRFLSCEPLLGPVDLSLALPCPICQDRGWTAPQPFAPYPAERATPCGRCILEAERAGHYIEPGGFARKKAAVSWVIVGGESGPNARPMHPDWARKIRDDCAAAGVPYFHKQNGEWASYDQIGANGWEFTREVAGRRYGRLTLRSDVGCEAVFGGQEFETRYPFPCGRDTGPCMVRVGKKRAGRLLDGREHNDMPLAAADALLARGEAA